jgi:hypothetical protein
MYKIKKQKKMLIGQSSMQDLNEIFNQLLGETKVLNLDIIYPKYKALYETYEKSYKLLDMLRNHIIIKHMRDEDDIIESDFNDVDEFMKIFKEFLVVNHNKYLIEEFNKKNVTLEDVNNNDMYDLKMVEELSDKYKNLKKSEITNVHIEYLTTILNYKKQLEECEDLRWINLISDQLFDIFPFTNLNFKTIINFNLDEEDKKLFNKFLALILKKKMDLCKKIYDIITTPDINVKDLASLILENLDNFKKEIPRCDKAFNKIEEALRTLEDKFNDYYKDYVVTNDPSIMIQNFLSDIYKKGKEDPTLVVQLRKIIKYFTDKIKTHKNSNSNINGIVDKLNNLFKENDTTLNKILKKENINTDDEEIDATE